MKGAVRQLRNMNPRADGRPIVADAPALGSCRRHALLRWILPAIGALPWELAQLLAMFVSGILVPVRSVHPEPTIIDEITRSIRQLNTRSDQSPRGAAFGQR